MMEQGVREAPNHEDLRCPRCGKNPGASSMINETTWGMDYCEECGLDAEEGPHDFDELDFELPDDPHAYSEEMRRLHESQV